MTQPGEIADAKVTAVYRSNEDIARVTLESGKSVELDIDALVQSWMLLHNYRVDDRRIEREIKVQQKAIRDAKDKLKCSSST